MSAVRDHRIDWNFRPKWYFGTLDTKKGILNRIQGTARRRAIQAALEDSDLASVPPNVIAGQLDEVSRQAFGRLHPSFMGGEYLPALDVREIEIARIELKSVMSDVISIRAREGKSRITYSIVDEYDNPFNLAIKSSRKPLTLRQMVGLFRKSFCVHNHLPQYGLALSFLALPYANNGGPIEHLEGFVKVRSDFYPQLEEIFDDVFDRFMFERAFDGLSVSAPRFMAQFTQDERDTLVSAYGRPWRASFRTHIEKIERYDVDLLKLKRRHGPPRKGWFEDITKRLDGAVKVSEAIVS